MTIRIGIIGVYHESNSFSARLTGIDAFEARWYTGLQIVVAFTGSRTVVGGFLDEAVDRAADIVPLFATYATPSGRITRSAFDGILAAAEAALLSEAAQLDGMLLELHGDMDVEDTDDPEEEIVRLVKTHMGVRPMVAVLDFHANMGKPRLGAVDALVGYRLNPHIDTYERGREAVQLLMHAIESGTTLYRAHRGLAIVIPPAAQRTEEDPFKSILDHADRVRSQPFARAVSVFGGYAYLDATYTGMGFTVYADESDAGVAEAAVGELVAAAKSVMARFQVDYPDADEAVADAVAREGVIVVADTGDNIDGGSPGDATWLAHAAMAHPKVRFLMTVCDPSAIEALSDAPVGSRRAMSLGGWAGPLSGAPLSGDVTILGRSPGVFVNRGPMATGMTTDMGGACWLRLRNLDILVQARPTQPNDPQMFEHIGIDPASYGVLLLKGAAALRAGWGSFAAFFVDAGTPGETDSLVARLPYRSFLARGS